MQDTVLSNMTCQVVYITGQWLLGLVGEMVSRKREKCRRKAVIEIPFGEIGAKVSEHHMFSDECLIMFSLTGRSLVPLIPCYEIRHIRGYL